jgi:hypothetical protein
VTLCHRSLVQQGLPLPTSVLALRYPGVLATKFRVHACKRSLHATENYPPACHPKSHRAGSDRVPSLVNGAEISLFLGDGFDRRNTLR